MNRGDLVDVNTAIGVLRGEIVECNPETAHVVEPMYAVRIVRPHPFARGVLRAITADMMTRVARVAPSSTSG
jgi:hypothetical protein